MRRFRRWLREFALRYTGVGDLLNRAGDVIRESRRSAPNDADQAMALELQLQMSNLRGRMNEMLDLRRAEVACYKPDATCLQESAHVETVAHRQRNFYYQSLNIPNPHRRS